MNTLGRLILNTHDLVLSNVSKFSVDQVREEQPEIKDIIPRDSTVLFTEKVSDEVFIDKNSFVRQGFPMVDEGIENMNENLVEDDDTGHSDASGKITSHYASEIPNEQRSVSVYCVTKDKDKFKTITDKRNSTSICSSHSSNNSDVGSLSSDEIVPEIKTEEKNDKKSVLFVNNHEEANGEAFMAKFSNEEEDEGKIIVSKEESSKSQFKMAKNLKAVKSLGLDLVEEMKEKKKEMKQWTERKVPGLKR